jgi:hypothetical protein
VASQEGLGFIELATCISWDSVRSKTLIFLSASTSRPTVEYIQSPVQWVPEDYKDGLELVEIFFRVVMES